MKLDLEPVEFNWQIDPEVQRKRDAEALRLIAGEPQNLQGYDSTFKPPKGVPNRTMLRDRKKDEKLDLEEVKLDLEPVEQGMFGWGEDNTFSVKRLGKEAVGLGLGVADAVMSAASIPISGVAGLVGSALPGPEGQGASVVQKTQELLSPSAAAEKMGLPPDMASQSGSAQLLMTILGAPHEYLSKPIADKYHELTGDSLGAAILQGAIDIPAYILAFKAGKAGLERTVGKPTEAQVATARDNLGYGSDAEARAKIMQDMEAKTYADNLAAVDNNVVRYPQDYQAPQFGMGGQSSLPPGAVGGRKAIPEGAERIRDQAAMDADLAATAADLQRQRDTPIPYERPELGLEQRGSDIAAGGPANMVWDNFRGTEIPTYGRQTPLELLSQDRNPLPKIDGIPYDYDLARTTLHEARFSDTQAVPFDPVQIYTSVANKMDRVGAAALIDRMEGNPTIKKLTSDITKQKDYIKGLEEQLATEKMTQEQNRRYAEGTGEVPPGYKGYQERITRIEKQLETAKSVLKQMNEKGAKTTENIANNMARVAPKIEKTKDGRQMLRLNRLGGPGKKQRGVIDVDLLTFGIPKLIEKLGVRKTIEKFKGTYNPRELISAINTHNNMMSKDILVMMSPDDFHQLASTRGHTDIISEFAQKKRARIREGLKGPAGLHDIPYLNIEVVYENGKWIAQVKSHEGRHRMDVFKELGLEQVPVNIYFKDGAFNDYPLRYKPKLLDGRLTIDEIRSQDNFWGTGNADVALPFPKIEDLRESLDYSAKARKQAGAANVDLLTDIATLGISALVRKGLTSGDGGPPKHPMGGQPKKSNNQKDVLQLASGETRSPKERLESLKPEERVDIPETLAGANLAQQTNASFLSQFTKHPMVQYVGARVNQAVRGATLLGNLIKEGSSFSLSHGRLKRNIDPNSPRAVWNGLSKQEKQKLSDIANEFGAKTELSREQVRSLGGSDKVANAYKVFVDAYRRAITEVNKLRPNDPINELPGYFPKFRQGDFKLSVYDPKNPETPIYVDLFWTRGFGGLFGRSKMEKFLKEKFPDMEIKVSTVDRGNRGNPYNVTTVPFEQLMKAMDKGDPRARAIESAIREYSGKRGFGRHAIQRKNIGGGELTPNNFYKAFETYIDSAMRYKSNLEMTKLDMELKGLTDLNAPRFKEWASTYIDMAKGGYNPGAFVNGVYKALEVLTTAVSFGQFGPNAPAHIIRAANNYFMAKALFFWRPPFLIAQKMQPYQFTPQWLAHYQTQGYTGGVAKAMYEGQMNILKSLANKENSDFRSFIEDYMAPRGNIDPTMIHAMDLFGEGTGRGHEVGRWIMGTAPAQIVEAIGRLEASAYSYAFFKNSGLKGKDLYVKAEEAVNNIMTDYSRHEMPGWINKSGIIGQMVGPLSTFATNFWSTTALFLKDIGQNPGKIQSYKPMGIHIAQTFIWAGLTGLLGMQVADMGIELLKKIGVLDPKTPNATEAVLTAKTEDGKHAVSDLAAFGVISGMTGMNFGASMAAPEMRMPTANSIPGIKLMEEFITNLYGIMKTNATKADRQLFLKTVMPNYVNSLLERYDIDPDTMDFRVRERGEGEIVTDPNKRGFGITRPNEFDKTARLLGTRSLNETRELAGVRQAEATTQLLNQKKSDLIDAGADSIMFGKGRPIEELIEDAAKLDMNIKDYLIAVQRAMRNRELEAEQRQYGIVPKTPNQLRKYEQIEAYK